MLSAYYACGEDSSALFDGLTISHTASYRQHLNQYNVIKVNMQDFLSMTHSMDEMLTMLQKYLSFDLLEQFEHIRFRDENNLIQFKSMPEKLKTELGIDDILRPDIHIIREMKFFPTRRQET